MSRSPRDAKALAEEIERVMAERGLTQAEMAQRTGLSESVISRIRNERVSRVHGDTLERLSKVLHAGMKSKLVVQIMKVLSETPILMLLAQAEMYQDDVIGEVVGRLKEEERGMVLDISLPFSKNVTIERYFTFIADQCGFVKTEEDVDSAFVWETTLMSHLEERRVFIVIRRFEQGPEEGRQELAGILRSLAELYRERLKVLLVGGERLANLKYGKGDLSLLNEGQVLHWPEWEVDDVLELQRHKFSQVQWGGVERSPEKILEYSGGHPELIRYYLELFDRDPKATVESQVSADLPLWSRFTVYQNKPECQKICNYLCKDDLGPDLPWPPDPLLRRLYWSNLLTQRHGRFQWRCRLIKTMGKEALGCGDSSHDAS